MNAMTSSLVPAIGWALIDFLWQGALVGLAATIVLMLLRNARPQARYAVACAALALCLALPVAGTLGGMAGAPHVAGSPAARFVQFTGTTHETVALTAQAPDWHASLQLDLPWIVALWSIGAALLAARMAVGMTWVARAGRIHGEPHPRWQRRLDHLAERIGVECKVRLRVVADLASPVAAGCWKPVVLVPAALIARMPLDLVEALLAHELAHVRRHDYLVNLLQSAIEALLFYHPVVWWLSRRIRVEREQIADDIAAHALGNPQRLALALHELDLFQDALNRAGGPLTSLIPAANGGHLMSRIQRLIRPNQHALSWKIALPIVGLTAICLSVHASDSTAVPGAHVATPAPAVAVDDTPATRASVAVAARTKAREEALRAALAHAYAQPLLDRTTQRAIAQAAAAAKDAGRAMRLAVAEASNRDAYAVVRSDREGITMSGDTRDIPLIESTKKKVHGDFLWMRHGGRSYVVQDPALVGRAIEAWKVTEPIEKQMQALEERMKVPEQRMEALSRQMEALEHVKSPEGAAMEKLQVQMEPLQREAEAIGRKMEALGGKMEDATAAQRETLQRQMETLQAQMDPVSAKMEQLGALMEKQGTLIEQSVRPIEKLGKQMEAESKPMEALGREMEALGRQEDVLSKEVDAKVHALLEEALRDGKATPVENLRQ